MKRPKLSPSVTTPTMLGTATVQTSEVLEERYEWPLTPLRGEWLWWRGSGAVGGRPGIFCWQGLVDAEGMPVPGAAVVVWVQGGAALSKKDFRDRHDRFERVR